MIVKRVGVGVVGVGLLGVLFMSQLTAQIRRTAEQTQRSVDVRRQQIAAYSVGGLAAAAKVTGVYQRRAPVPNVGLPVSLDELAAVSEHIVLGWTDSNIGTLTSDGFSIETNYSVRVWDVFKGTIIPGSSITVVVPGGKVGFPDGSTAQVLTPGFFPPLNARQCVFFLRRVADRGVGTYEVEHTALGMYDVTNKDRVHPVGQRTSRLARKLWAEKLDSNQFLSRIRGITSR